MPVSLFNPLLHLSYLHLLSYTLVAGVIVAALAHAFMIRSLRQVLRHEFTRLREVPTAAHDGAPFLHPAARALGADHQAGRQWEAVRRQVDLAEAALFIPLRSRMSLTRDLSTLMGLIATLLALVAAASDFAKHGQPELLVGSIGTGCVATCVAAIGCAVALWNLSRLAQLRLETATNTEQFLTELENRAADWETPAALASDHSLTQTPILSNCHAPI